MIDVRQAERLQSRTPVWLRERLEFLDNFRTIYGLDQTTSGSSAEASRATERMSLAEAYPARVNSEAPSSSLPQPSIRRKAISGTASDAGSDATSAGQLRVKPPQSILQDSNARESAPKKLPGDESQVGVATTRNPSPLLSPVSEIRSQSSTFPEMHLRRKPVEAAVPASSNTGFVATTVGDPDSLAGLAEPPRSSPSARGAHQEHSFGAENQESRPEQKSLPRVMEIPQRHVSSLEKMHLQRKHDLLQGSAESTTARVSEMGTGPSGLSLPTHAQTTSLKRDKRSGWVSQEIPATSLAPVAAAIVWRKPNTDGDEASTHSVASGAQLVTWQAGGNVAQLMRQTASDSGASAPPSPPANTTMSVAPSSSDGAPEIMDMAERVSRVIARQLAIERERRGKTR